ncbi:tRNA synthetases class I-domain-containing protein [Phlebopus sp. FC_14]|nr:tRNA synthetases class I-domain-containing protein [Phlebopus sp. FC_14]
MSLSGSRHVTSALCTRLFCRRVSSISSSTAKLDSKAFSKTLLLPKTPFPLWHDPAKSETPFRHRTCDELYRWQMRHATGPLFVMHDGPPYANGHLHIGHALNKILKDIINRYHVSIGDRVHYIPGWDCHGLPIENKALQDLKKDPQSLPPSSIREAAKATAQREMKIQQEEFKQFGILADWSPESTYRTLDHSYELRQLRIFQQMVSKGLIYRHYRPVYYSPSSRSALAEAELVYKDDHISHSVYVAFALDTTHITAGSGCESAAATTSPTSGLARVLQESRAKEVCLLVWTTTPWTLTANMGIAVHPNLLYTLVSSTRYPSLLIVAKDRLSSLENIIGTSEVLTEFHGSELVGLKYHSIFSRLSSDGSSTPTSSFSQSSPPSLDLHIIPALHVTPDSGTGLVHCAPAHGAEDYLAFRTQGLLDFGMLCHVDGEGKFSERVTDVVGRSQEGTGVEGLIGLDVLKAGSKAVVKLLEVTGSLLAIEKIKHKYPYDWKTNEPVIVTATSQWFANLDGIKDDALTALEEVTFYPPASRNRLTSFVRSRSEWCISRQRVWGVPIPALHHIPSGSAVLTTSSLTHILSVLDAKGVRHWWDGPVSDFLTPELIVEYGGDIENPDGAWAKGTDTMDVWFDSGTSWSMLAEEDGRRYRADVCLEGSDQHRGWFQSQLLTAIGAMSDGEKRPSSPYGSLITHGMVLDEAGKKMSKSLGNVISPLTVIHGGEDKKKEPAYGTDILRLWAATVEYWRDMSIGPTVLAQTSESMRKIRNSARFMLGNIASTKLKVEAPLPPVEKKDLGLAERYVMNELYKLEKTAFEGYSTYNFPRVMNALTNFANITLSSLYFDITKDVLYASDAYSKERRMIVDTLKRILGTMTSVLAPVLPHLAEEIHAQREDDAAGVGQSFFTKKWEPLNVEWEDHQAEKDMSSLLVMRSVVLTLLEKARGDKNLKSALEANAVIAFPPNVTGVELVELLKREESFLKTLFIVSDVRLVEDGHIINSPGWSYSGSIDIPDSGVKLMIRVEPAALHKCPRCWTFTRPEHEELCPRCKDVVRKA